MANFLIALGKKKLAKGSIFMKEQKAFTLIEILIVIGIMSILAAIVIIAINPAEQFAQARNAQRQSDVRTILNAVHQNMVRNSGVWTCAAGVIPASATNMADPASDPTGYDICNCLVTTYVAEMPFDPKTGDYTNLCADYDSAYEIIENAPNNRITVSAPDAELSETISVTR